MGLKINSEFRPPQYDLFMEPSAEIEMQTLTSRSGGPWTRAPNREIEEKLDTLDAEEQAIAKREVLRGGTGDPAMLPEARTELTRTRVQLPSGDYQALDDGTDWQVAAGPYLEAFSGEPVLSAEARQASMRVKQG